MRKIAFLLFFLSLFFLSAIKLFVSNNDVYENFLSLNDCLLPADHPNNKRLENLFHQIKMFKSQNKFQNSGFIVYPRAHRGLMVAEHPHLKNYVFKKFKNKIPLKNQISNYISRVNGARALKKFIEEKQLKHIVVPQKWIYPLPDQFNDPETHERAYILIAEKINICSGGKDPKGEVAKRYHQIDLDVLKELCIVVYHFRGLDSVLTNMPFTKDNKIAFIDTDKWNIARNASFLHEAMKYLSDDRKLFAQEIFKELSEQHSDPINFFP